MSRRAEISCLLEIAGKAQIAAGAVASAYLASPEPAWTEQLKDFHGVLVLMVEQVVQALLAQGVLPSEAGDAIRDSGDQPTLQSFSGRLAVAIEATRALEQELSDAVEAAAELGSGLVDLAALSLLRLRTHERALAVFMSTEASPIAMLA